MAKDCVKPANKMLRPEKPTSLAAVISYVVVKPSIFPGKFSATKKGITLSIVYLSIWLIGMKISLTNPGLFSPLKYVVDLKR